MNIGCDVSANLRLSRADIPIELRVNFEGLKNIPLFYAGYVKKLNRVNKVQNRILIVTLDHVYLSHPNGDITRCFPFSYITAIFLDPIRKHVALVVPREYDAVLAVPDPYHLIHIIETLRGLHHSDSPLGVQLVDRPRMSPEVVEHPVKPSTKPTSFLGKVAYRVFNRVPKGIIPGWNDEWTDDPNPTNRPGNPEEICIGKGIYAVCVTRPPAYKLSLHNRVESPP